MPGYWTIASLTRPQQEILEDAEQSLDADYLLAYDPPEGGTGETKPPIPGLHVAELDDSQVECLQGLETQLNAVVVAYDE